MRRGKLECSIFLFLFISASLDAACTVTRPLTRAHSHNDYKHKRPLLDALSCGFMSVEADIFLVGGKLLVGHSPSELKEDRTLENLYLKPLRERAGRNAGRILPGAPPLILLVDIKTDADSTYAALRKLLLGYSDILTCVRGGKVELGAVSVILSGNRPISALKAQKVRYAMLDGRLSDLQSDLPSHLMPLVSDRWSKLFTWNGKGPMPPEERKTLRSIVRQAHRMGRKVRFWASPDRPSVWKELVEAGVDLINTDDLEGLSAFLSKLRARVFLPPPQKKGGMPLNEALLGRHSTRSFKPDPLPLRTLGQILWAARGINRPQSGKTTSPSAFEAYSVSVYVVLPEGPYRYIPGLHLLEPVGVCTDVRKDIVTQQSFAQAPFLLVFVCDLSLLPPRVPREKRALWANAECGTLGQNVYLEAQSLGLGTVFAAALRTEAAVKALRLSSTQVPCYVMPVGLPAD